VLERGHIRGNGNRAGFSLRQFCSGLAPRKKPESFESLRGPERTPSIRFEDEKSATPLESYLNETRAKVQLRWGKIPAVYREVLVLRFQKRCSSKKLPRLEHAGFHVKSRSIADSKRRAGQRC